MATDNERKTEHEFQRSTTADPIYTARTHGISQDWTCECGADVTTDSHLLGQGRAAYAMWCNKCGKPMDRNGSPRKVSLVDMADKYGLTGEEDVSGA